MADFFLVKSQNPHVNLRFFGFLKNSFDYTGDCLLKNPFPMLSMNFGFETTLTGLLAKNECPLRKISGPSDPNLTFCWPDELWDRPNWTFDQKWVPLTKNLRALRPKLDFRLARSTLGPPKLEFWSKINIF